MRTLRAILLCMSIVATALTQPSVAMQSIHISVQVPSSLTSATPSLAMHLRSVGRQTVARATDRFAVRSQATGRKISALIKRSLPKGSSLSVRLMAEADRPVSQVHLSAADAPVDVLTDLRSRGVTEHRVEYVLTSTAPTQTLASGSQTIVYTLTD